MEETPENRTGYTLLRNHVAALVDRAKSEFYTKVANDNKDCPRGLFKIINTLLNNKKESPLPPHTDAETLANEFCNFFIDKISLIRENILNSMPSSGSVMPPEVKKFTMALNDFRPTNEEEVKRFLLASPSKSCVQDPIPTWLLKSCESTLVPLITRIINSILLSSEMPENLKIAVVRPLLKKLILDLILKNYHPVSNLPFLSKLTEKIVLERLNEHILSNNLKEMFQSAYCKAHSTETALLRVRNDILSAMDKQQVTLLIMLDLSSAFDTIDHEILFKRLSDRLGIQGHALQWIKSYLTGRGQYISINGETSEVVPLLHGVPQGSVLGPVLFTMYIIPLGDIP